MGIEACIKEPCVNGVNDRAEGSGVRNVIARLAEPKQSPAAEVKMPAKYSADANRSLHGSAQLFVRESRQVARVPELIEGLENGDKRYLAIEELRERGFPAVMVSIPELIKLLGDESWIIRDSAVLALGERGPAALPAAQALVEALGDQVYEVNQDAARSLGKIVVDSPFAMVSIAAAITVRAAAGLSSLNASSDALRHMGIDILILL